MKSLHELRERGTYRPSRDGDCFLEVEPPPRPGDLTGAAGAFWDEVVKCAVTAGTIAIVDGKALRLMADSWVHYLDCQDAIAEHGVLIVSETRHGVTHKSNPALVSRDRLWRQIVDGLRQFGLTPRARRGINTGGQAGETDESRRIADVLGLGRSDN